MRQNKQSYIHGLVVIAWGILFFGDASGPLSIVGAAISVGGGFAYARALSKS